MPFYLIENKFWLKQFSVEHNQKKKNKKIPTTRFSTKNEFLLHGRVCVFLRSLSLEWLIKYFTIQSH